jgi:hypothetical protein
VLPPGNAGDEARVVVMAAGGAGETLAVVEGGLRIWVYLLSIRGVRGATFRRECLSQGK